MVFVVVNHVAESTRCVRKPQRGVFRRHWCVLFVFAPLPLSAVPCFAIQTLVWNVLEMADIVDVWRAVLCCALASGRVWLTTTLAVPAVLIT